MRDVRPVPLYLARLPDPEIFIDRMHTSAHSVVLFRPPDRENMLPGRGSAPALLQTLANLTDDRSDNPEERGA